MKSVSAVITQWSKPAAAVTRLAPRLPTIAAATTVYGLRGEPVADGELGELVLTSLTKEAFPVLRYRTRDLTRLLPGTVYPAMRRIEKITGRDDDMIILRGVNLFPTQIEELVMGMAGLTPHFVLELRRDGRMDAMTVRIERHPSLDAEAGDRAGEELARAVKVRIGTSVEVRMEEPGTLPRSEGKYRRVYDLREPRA